MRRRFLRGLASACLIVGIPCLSAPVAHAVSANPTPVCTTNCKVTFTKTGDYYAWTVPGGVTSLQLTLAGAQGANSGSSVGGKGGIDTGTLSVTPLSTIYVFVGGQDGYNGGGAAGTAGSYSSGNGGGATDVRIGGTTYINRYMVAGGGGGAGKNGCSTQTGGAGGYPGGLGGYGDGRKGGDGTLTGGGSVAGNYTTSSGTCVSSPWGGAGGGQQGGGGGGGYGISTGGTNGSCGTYNDHVYTNGAINNGLASQGGCFGTGGAGGNYSSNGNGGGGGGGWYGGGAGGANWGTGGGGGSDFLDSATVTSYSNGAESGDGFAIIIYGLPSPTTIVLSDSQNRNAVYRTIDILTATLTGSDGKVKFLANGKTIPGCQTVQSAGLLAQCNWRASVHGTISIYAVLAPPPGYTGASSANLVINTIARSTTR